MAVGMPDRNMPAMKMNAAGARNIPPPMASPLVQPPASPAPYSRMTPPANATSQRFRTDAPNTARHCGSGTAARRKSPDSLADTNAPAATPASMITSQLMPGGITNLKYVLLARSGTTYWASRPARFSNAPDPPGTMPVNAMLAIYTTPSSAPARYGDHSFCFSSAIMTDLSGIS